MAGAGIMVKRIVTDNLRYFSSADEVRKIINLPQKHY
jgi:hypothetical protein